MTGPDVRVLVSHDRPEAWRGLLAERFPSVPIDVCGSGEDLAQALARHRATVVFSFDHGGAKGDRLKAIFDCPSVEWVQTATIGVDHLPPWDAGRVTVTNAAGLFGDCIGEYVLGCMLSANLRLPAYRRQQARREWKPQGWRMLRDQTLAVVGLGNIGRAVARRAKCFGMRVVGVRRSSGPADGVDAIYPADGLHDALSAADFVSVQVPLTAETRHLIDARALSRMKPAAWLINVSRGEVIDEAALIDRLRSGRIGGAVLDVFKVEPLPPESPLWELENVVVTPHASGWTLDWEREPAERFCDNLARWIAGRPLASVVEPPGVRT